MIAQIASLVDACLRISRCKATWRLDFAQAAALLFDQNTYFVALAVLPSALGGAPLAVLLATPSWCEPSPAGAGGRLSCATPQTDRPPWLPPVTPTRKGPLNMTPKGGPLRRSHHAPCPAIHVTVHCMHYAVTECNVCSAVPPKASCRALQCTDSTVAVRFLCHQKRFRTRAYVLTGARLGAPTRCAGLPSAQFIIDEDDVSAKINFIFFGADRTCAKFLDGKRLHCPVSTVIRISQIILKPSSNSG